ncbi:MAG: PLDc N-terminal domain-containing protein, partial [Oscillospiraceae bacterium]|nr:PLDc N-terminal domain-containing protein [Oscillospiraceae bacterium]
MKKIVKFLTGRFFIRGLILLLQLLVIFAIGWWLNSYSFYINIAFMLVSAVFAFVIINDDTNPMFKVSWLLLMLAFPIAGWFFYIMFGRKRYSKRLQKRYNEMVSAFGIKDANGPPFTDGSDPTAERLFRYIYNTSHTPVYTNTDCRFFPCGEDFFDVYISELKKADRFIFIEYFIIN